jgi:hypothetical protein
MESISGVQVWEHWNKSQSFQSSAREEMQPCVKKRNRVFKIRVGLGGPYGTEKNFSSNHANNQGWLELESHEISNRVQSNARFGWLNFIGWPCMPLVLVLSLRKTGTLSDCPVLITKLRSLRT